MKYRGLVVRHGGHILLGPIDFHIDIGESIALFGPSGCGKTTLCRFVIAPNPSLSIECEDLDDILFGKNKNNECYSDDDIEDYGTKPRRKHSKHNYTLRVCLL